MMLKSILYLTLLIFIILDTGCIKAALPPAKQSNEQKVEKTHVRRGENLKDIAIRCQTTPANLIKLNKLRPPFVIYVNQPLYYEKQALPAPTSKQPVKNEPVLKLENETIILPAHKPIQKNNPVIIQPDSKEAPAKIEETKPTEKLTRSGKYFSWPLEGKIISKFGKKKLGLTNDGINIQAEHHAPVKAAENGIVVYAGNEIKGLGNLILIKHADHWTSAYAHNDILLVEKGQQVTRGDVIAKAGKTGNVKQTQLHFELRKKTEPVDPTKYLK